MSATTRVFTFTGIMTAPVAPGSGRFASDSVGLLKYPYLARESVNANTTTAQNTGAALTPDGTTIALVQVQPGKAVHFEMNPPNRSVAADVSSPVMTGDNIVRLGVGWTLSLLEADLS